MTRQAISPRFAIRIRLNICWLTCNLWAGPLHNLARGDGCNNSVVQQNQTEATADMPEIRFSSSYQGMTRVGKRPAITGLKQFGLIFTRAIKSCYRPGSSKRRAIQKACD
jgi:hypothetical protein